MKRVHLLSSTADMSFRVQQVRSGYPGSEVWVRETELDRLREALDLVLPLAKGYAAQNNVGSNRRYIEVAEAALAAPDGEDGE